MNIINPALTATDTIASYSAFASSALEPKISVTRKNLYGSDVELLNSTVAAGVPLKISTNLAALPTGLRLSWKCGNEDCGNSSSFEKSFLEGNQLITLELKSGDMVVERKYIDVNVIASQPIVITMPKFHREQVAGCQEYSCITDSNYSDSATTEKHFIILDGNPWGGCSGSGSLKVMDSYGNTGIGTVDPVSTTKVPPAEAQFQDYSCSAGWMSFYEGPNYSTYAGMAPYQTYVDVSITTQVCNGNYGTYYIKTSEAQSDPRPLFDFNRFSSMLPVHSFPNGASNNATVYVTDGTGKEYSKNITCVCHSPTTNEEISCSKYYFPK